MNKYGLILEGLQVQRQADSFFDSLRESTNLDIFESYDVIEEQMIDEGSVVTFNGQPFPDFGAAVILAGGPGSGKGYFRKHRLLGNFKVFDVDRLKELYIMAQEKGKFSEDSRKYDLKNPEDVSALHQKVKEHDFKNKQEKAFFDNLNQGRLTNVLYDITGDDGSKLGALGRKLKSIGYKVSLVWIVVNRQVAMLQNLSRDRVVSQQVFHTIHNEVAKNVFPFLKNGAKDYDEAWLVFNSLNTAKSLSPAERKNLDEIGCVKLEKSGSGFSIPKEIEMMLFNILGPMEEDPLHPRTYKNFSDVQGKDQAIARIKAGTDSLLQKVK